MSTLWHAERVADQLTDIGVEGSSGMEGVAQDRADHTDVCPLTLRPTGNARPLFGHLAFVVQPPVSRVPLGMIK